MLVGMLSDVAGIVALDLADRSIVRLATSRIGTFLRSSLTILVCRKR
jgi:hypothetical protein